MSEEKPDFKPEENKTENKSVPPQNPIEPKEKIKEIHHYHYHERRSNLGRIFLGILIIFIGLILLADTTGIFSFDLSFNWVKLWPLAIIFVGLAMLSRGLISGIIGALVIIIVLSVISLVFFLNLDGGSTTLNEPISIIKESNIQSAKIAIEAGAINLKLTGEEKEKLVSGNLESNFLKLETDSKVTDNIQTINIKEKGTWKGFKKHINKLDLSLNSETPLDLDLNSGASTLNLNLSNLISKNVSIDTGASTLEIILGEKVTQSNLTIKAGASTVDITLPKNLGAEVKVSSGLTAKNLPDFKEIDSYHYESMNYGKAEKKVDINLELGVSTLNFHWQ